MSNGKLPAIQFYPGDWLRDDVAGCSLAAQGLWLRLIFVMHDADPYGHLATKGQPMTRETQMKRCGTIDVTEFETAWNELVTAGVPRQNEHGIWYSSRMVKDAKKRDSSTQRVREFRDRKRAETEMKLHSSSSSSSSSSPSGNKEREGDPSTQGLNGHSKKNLLSLPSGFFERYFNHETEHHGRWALKEFVWCYFKPEEFHQAHAQWQKKGIPEEDWKINLRILDGKMQKKSKDGEVREGMANQYLCTFMLTEALTAKRKHQLTTGK